MSKDEYLHKLNHELRKYFNEKETKVIVSDYDEYFELGAIDGKSEEDLISQFGAPEKLVAELIEDNSSIRKNSIALIKLKTYTSKAAFCALTTLVLLMGQKIGNNLLVDGAVVLAVPLLILCWIANNYSFMGHFDSKGFKAAKILCILSLIIGLIIWVADKGWLSFYIFNLNDDLPDTLLSQLGPAVASSIGLVKLISITSIIYFYFMAIKKKYYKRSSLLFLFFGIIQTCNNITTTLYDMSDPEILGISLRHALYPLIIGILATIISFLYLRMRQKG